MTNFIGGLFKKTEQAEAAFGALKQAGFDKESITMLIRKQVPRPDFKKRPSAGDVFFSAFLGGILLAFVGAIVALLVGTGRIPTPGFMPEFEPGQLRTTTYLAMISFAVSFLIGAILGAAYRLIIAPESPEITSRGVAKGALLVVVNVDDTQKKTARTVLEQSGAVDVENLSQKWDPEVWGRYRGIELLENT